MKAYSLIREILLKKGIQHFGWTLLQQPLSIGLYSQWLNKGQQGSMQYLKDHEIAKALKTEGPEPLNPTIDFRSAIVITIDYHPNHPWPWPTDPLPHLLRAKYSKGLDYHGTIKGQLENIIQELSFHFPQESFKAWVDSGPVLERDLAYRAGLGWVGKNSCLINKNRGSFFVIAEIYSSLLLENQNPLFPDHCGSCRACITACPTGAIDNNRSIDAKKCISYWTIESKSNPPEELRSKFGSWLFGCDICQDVCPWNKKKLLKTELFSTADSDQQRKELEWILTASNKEIGRKLHGSALARAAGTKLKRNALIVIANNKILSLRKNVHDLLQHPQLAELAQWTLNQLDQ